MRKALSIVALAALTLLAGCETRGGAGYSVGYAGGDYDGYYDGFYGPYPGGYWGNGGFFYYSDGHGGYRRDDDHHFRHERFEHAQGFHAEHHDDDRDGHH